MSVEMVQDFSELKAAFSKALEVKDFETCKFLLGSIPPELWCDEFTRDEIESMQAAYTLSRPTGDREKTFYDDLMSKASSRTI